MDSVRSNFSSWVWISSSVSVWLPSSRQLDQPNQAKLTTQIELTLTGWLAGFSSGKLHHMFARRKKLYISRFLPALLACLQKLRAQIHLCPNSSSLSLSLPISHRHTTHSLQTHDTQRQAHKCASVYASQEEISVPMAKTTTTTTSAKTVISNPRVGPNKNVF